MLIFFQTIDDPAGNSFIESPMAPAKDPSLTVVHYTRTRQQDIDIGCIVRALGCLHWRVNCSSCIVLYLLLCLLLSLDCCIALLHPLALLVLCKSYCIFIEWNMDLWPVADCHTAQNSVISVCSCPVRNCVCQDDSILQRTCTVTYILAEG
jgi:hypothetical protein